MSQHGASNLFIFPGLHDGVSEPLLQYVRLADWSIDGIIILSKLILLPDVKKKTYKLSKITFKYFHNE